MPAPYPGLDRASTIVQYTICRKPTQASDRQSEFDLSTEKYTINSTLYPQEISPTPRFSLARPTAICKSVFTAKVLRNRRGARRPQEAGADREGSSEPDRNAIVFGRQLDRKGSSEQLRTGRISRAQASHERIFGNLSGGDGSQGSEQNEPDRLRGEKFRKASGCVRKGTMRGPRLSIWRLFLFHTPNQHNPKSEAGLACLSNQAPPSASADALPRLRTCVRTDTLRRTPDQPDVA
jgi:hypothetical protein